MTLAVMPWLSAPVTKASSFPNFFPFFPVELNIMGIAISPLQCWFVVLLRRILN